MRKYDRETTNPIIIEEEFRFAKGTRHSVKYPVPGFMTGDWLVSPSGETGYIAGRSLENPELWLFVIKTGPSGWDQQVVEMREDAFVGFKPRPKEESDAPSPLDDEAV